MGVTTAEAEEVEEGIGVDTGRICMAVFEKIMAPIKAPIIPREAEMQLGRILKAYYFRARIR